MTSIHQNPVKPINLRGCFSALCNRTHVIFWPGFTMNSQIIFYKFSCIATKKKTESSWYLYRGSLFRRKLSLKVSGLPGFIACTFSLNADLQNMLILSQEISPPTKQQTVKTWKLCLNIEGSPQEILKVFQVVSVPFSPILATVSGGYVLGNLIWF